MLGRDRSGLRPRQLLRHGRTPVYVSFPEPDRAVVSARFDGLLESSQRSLRWPESNALFCSGAPVAMVSHSQLPNVDSYDESGM